MYLILLWFFSHFQVKRVNFWENVIVTFLAGRFILKTSMELVCNAAIVRAMWIILWSVCALLAWCYFCPSAKWTVNDQITPVTHYYSCMFYQHLAKSFCCVIALTLAGDASVKVINKLVCLQVKSVWMFEKEKKTHLFIDILLYKVLNENFSVT